MTKCNRKRKPGAASILISQGIWLIQLGSRREHQINSRYNPLVGFYRILLVHWSHFNPNHALWKRAVSNVIHEDGKMGSSVQIYVGTLVSPAVNFGPPSLTIQTIENYKKIRCSWKKLLLVTVQKVACTKGRNNMARVAIDFIKIETLKHAH